MEHEKCSIDWAIYTTSEKARWCMVKSARYAWSERIKTLAILFFGENYIRLLQFQFRDRLLALQNMQLVQRSP